MANLEQRKVNQLRLVNTVLAAMGYGLYDMMGDSAKGLAAQFGESTLKTMENEMGLELKGESVATWAAEIGRLYVDEFAAGKTFNVKSGENTVYVEVTGCMFLEATKALQAANVPLFLCPVRAVCAAALNRLEIKARLGEIKCDGEKCSTTFELF